VNVRSSILGSLGSAKEAQRFIFHSHQALLLIPSNLLDTQSTLGHHYSLKKESSDLKHRVNKSVNLEMKSVGVRNKMEIHQRLTGRRLKSLVRPQKGQAAERQKNRKHVLNLLTA
ncbi:unnamed protein product, partial [Pocillopora meandrina]